MDEEDSLTRFRNHDFAAPYSAAKTENPALGLFAADSDTIRPIYNAIQHQIAEPKTPWSKRSTCGFKTTEALKKTCHERYFLNYTASILTFTDILAAGSDLIAPPRTI